MGSKIPALLTLVMTTAGSGGFSPSTFQGPPAGAIEGRVTFRAVARRAPQRYPGGRAETHQVQALPAIAYLVGRIPGAVAAGTGEHPTMTQRDTTFVPSVVAVQTGGSVSFPNRDPFFHNVFSYSSAQRFDLGRYAQGESKEVTFPEPGIVEVFCEVHDFMRGAILVTNNPYHATVGVDGAFRIDGVPPGRYTLAFWHPDYRPMQQEVVVAPDSATWVSVDLER